MKKKSFFLTLFSFSLIIFSSFSLMACNPTITLELSETYVCLSEVSAPYCIEAIVKENGVEVSANNLIWESSDPSVATVVDGWIDTKKIGTTIITVTYNELVATCEVEVDPVYQNVSNASDFVYYVQQYPSTNIKLTSDIHIINKSIPDGLSNVGSYIADTFNGYLDGQGYKIIINMHEAGRPHSTLFRTLNGVVKNVNVIVKRSDWGPGYPTHYPAIFETVNGTINNCIFNLAPHRFGTVWNLDWSFITSTGENAVIKNSLFHMATDSVNHPFIRSISDTTSISNVAIVSFPGVTLTQSRIDLIELNGTIDRLYIYDGKFNAVLGTVAYSYNSTENKILLVEETVDLNTILRYNVTTGDVSVVEIIDSGDEEVPTEISLNVFVFE